MDDIDLRGLSAEDAKAYVFQFATALKQAELELGRVKTDLEMWIKRVELATAKGAAELQAAAKAKVDELARKAAQLDEERSSLQYKVSRMREKLPIIGMSERSVDPDLLLAQMQMAATDPGADPLGEDVVANAKTEREINALGVDDALAALKKAINPPPKDSAPPEGSR